ncbi:hypothetical protein GXP70_28820 [Paenibacillus lycopersici]|uniref:Tetratricopeptide repeat protein n=1 Tax=Paenibacillus lycopersici TaxID=2704462 RepID=A0A6C0G7B6_9BACL|nr:hypothetical protein [Paenibacillus lycopersici]QHT63565.1 hypothetical protein GXP70_28820 [Paenibacillus lycopersici]
MDTVVIFPHCAWEAFPYGSLIERIGRGRSVRFVANAGALAGAPQHYGAIALDALDEWPWERTAVIVTHPCWLYEIAGRGPAALIALLPAEHENGGPGYTSCRDALCAMATMVATASETFYFEQWFRRGNVFLQDGLDTASDLLADAAASDAVAGKPIEALAKLQLRRRTDFRAEQLQALRPSAMQFFFQAVYHYLLGEGEQAERWTLDAFHLAVLNGEEGPVATYYRFLSVIRLLQGRAEDAIATYGISAATEEERAAYTEMRDRWTEGETDMAASLLYRANDDWRQAARLLERVLQKHASASEADDAPRAPAGADAAPASGSETVGSPSPLAGSRLAAPAMNARSGASVSAVHERARALLLEAYERSARPGAALALLPPPLTVKERLRRHLLEGRALALEGRLHDAVRALLQAAMTGTEPLTAIAELASMRAKAKRLAEGEFT